MIKVIVFSDIKIYCDGLSRILANTKPIKVIAAENNFDSAVAKIEQSLPDVILLDMTMKDSCQVAVKAKQLFPKAKIVALAVPENEDNIVECAAVGVSGYVAREASLDELIETVIRAKKGEFCCPAKIAAQLFNKVHDLACSTHDKYLSPISAKNNDRKTGLTRREQQIYDLMAHGLSNKLISRNLHIEVSTVKNHVHNILVKLDVKNRASAVSLLLDSCAPVAANNSLHWRSLDHIGR